MYSVVMGMEQATFFLAFESYRGDVPMAHDNLSVQSQRYVSAVGIRGM